MQIGEGKGMHVQSDSSGKLGRTRNTHVEVHGGGLRLHFGLVRCGNALYVLLLGLAWDVCAGLTP